MSKTQNNKTNMSQARSLELIDQIPVMVWSSGPDSKRHFFNRSWLEFRGRKMAEELDGGWFSGVHPEDIGHPEQAYDKALAKKSTFKVEYRLKRYDGHYRWVIDSGAPLYGADGELTGYIGSCIDVTEQRHIERSLQFMNQTLEERVKERTKELHHTNEALKRQVENRQKAEQQTQQKNGALKEVLAQIEIEKKSIKDQVVANVENIIQPLIEKMRCHSSHRLRSYIDLLEKNLSELTQSFGSHIKKPFYKLTPREVEICNMIKNGLTTKEIAHMTSSSARTIDAHRNKIRKKLGIVSQEVNLASYLQSL